MPIFAIALVLVSTFMHTGWNLIARDQRSSDILLKALLIVSVVGVGPALLAEFWGEPILPQVWGYLIVAGIFQGIYFLGLSLGYRTGDFSVVYPLARGLPVVMVALSDLVRGNAPNALGWLGIIFVSIGCAVLPLNTLRDFNLARYKNKALVFTLITAAATAGYSVADSAAAKVMPGGLLTALRYGLWEMLLSWLFYQFLISIFRVPMPTQATTPWRQILTVGILLFSAYGLVLWAYQLSDHPSYVVALRQFSIVLGVAAGALFLRESAKRLRLAAALAITLGGIWIALAK
jgi:drug/metabolite transporter (DMT)-like permease